MDSRYLRKDFSQLAPTPSSNFKRAGSGSQRASKPHKARGITEVSNRNTISKDSTQSNELWALGLRNRDTISKDLTQCDAPSKSEMQDRSGTSKDKIESDKARRTVLGRGGSLNPAQMGAIPPNVSPGLYAVHQPSTAQEEQIFQQDEQAQAQAQAYAQAQAQHAQAQAQAQVRMQAHARLVYNRLMGVAAAKFGGPENIPQDTVDKIKRQSYEQAEQSVRDLIQRTRRAQQQQQQFMMQQQQCLNPVNMNNPSAQWAAIREQELLHQQQQRQGMFAEEFQKMGIAGVNRTSMDMQLSPQQLHQLRQRIVPAGLGHVAAHGPRAAIMAQQLALQQQAAQQQQQQQAAMRRT